MADKDYHRKHHLKHSGKHHKGYPKDYFRSVNIRFLIHELKGPLDVLDTNMKMVEALGEINESQGKALKRAGRSAAKLRNLINSILEVGSSQSGRIDLQPFSLVECSLEVLAEALESVMTKDMNISAADADHKGLLEANGLQVVIAENAKDLYLVQDKTKYMCILGNLVRNCLRFRNSLVTVELSRTDDDMEIVVTDDGPGIDIESVRKMLEKHAHQHERRDHLKRKGHGIGLATAQILARYLGGDLFVDPEYRDGARFVLTLPIAFDQQKARDGGYEISDSRFVTSE